MLEKLISEGKTLESKALDAMIGKYFDSVEFEKWAAKGVTYLEQEHPSLSVTTRVIDSYKKLNSDTNYSFYQLLLGALESFE